MKLLSEVGLSAAPLGSKERTAGAEPGGGRETLLHVDALPQLKRGRPFVINGWALTAEPIKKITIRAGEITETARHGLRRADLVKEFSQFPTVSNSGFSCLMRSLGDTQPDQVTVILQTNSGKITSVDVPLTFAANSEGAGLSGGSSDPESAMLLTVEQVAIDRAGLLRVAGWVVAHSRLQSVEVFVEDRSVGIAEIGIEREDVAHAWPNYPNSLDAGFLLICDAGAFGHELQVKVRATALGGVYRETTIPVQRTKAKSARPAKDQYELVCDEALLTTSGKLTLVGWAVASSGIKHIEAFFEGETLGLAEFGGDRPDVGNKFPTIREARKSGFRFQGLVNPAKLKGEHFVSMVAVLADGRTKHFKIAVAPKTAEIVETASVSGGEDLLVSLDEPVVVGGVASQIANSGLQIAGWAIARSGIEHIDIELDGISVGKAYYGMRREDVAEKFPGVPNTLLSGFAFSLPGRALSKGSHRVAVVVCSKAPLERRIEFLIDVAASEEQDGPWFLRQRMPVSERIVAESLIQQLRPAHFEIWINCQRGSMADLAKTLRSIEQQVYEDWNIIVHGAARSTGAVKKLLAKDFSVVKSKISVRGSRVTNGLARESNNSDWVMPIEAGDVLGCDALFEFSVHASINPNADFLYGDERCLDPTPHSVQAFFKPDWSPDLLLSTNYIGRAWCATRAVVMRALSSPEDIVAGGPYDAVLRCTEKADLIEHVTKVVCERRPSNAETSKSEMKALEGAANRRGLTASVMPGRAPNTYRLQRMFAADSLVSIIIPTCAARGLIKTCVDSIRQKSTYKNIEIVCVDNILDEKNEWKAWLRENSDVVVEILEPFNWSRFNNIAAEEASGSYFLFLNDDIEVVQPDWLEALLEHAARSDVGVVGPQLLYPDGKVQHAGLFLSGPGTARHSFRYCEEHDAGYFGLALTQRNVIGVTGACMLVRAQVFKHLGGFNEAHAIINNDLDFCLRAHAKGLLNVFTPFSKLTHHELASRATIRDVHDVSAFDAQWSELFAAGDPFFNPNLSKDKDSYQYEAEPFRMVFAGHPIFRGDDVKRILAIKVDHIGDFLTAFPALQRIKEKFPDARLSVLAAPAAQHLAMLEPSIDELIPFEFFHARSGLGQIEIGDEKLSELRDRLAPYKFDIAIDLRKHFDTRKLLRYSGAKVVAGFEWRNQFPWLDVAVVWEGDERFTSKRQHVADDLINLVDAVAAAGNPIRSYIRKCKDGLRRRIKPLRGRGPNALFRKQIVCVHPASGTEMRQWPVGNFATLINMLLRAADVDIAVIGGPDERELAESMIGQIQQRNRVTSLVGDLTLAELPDFIRTCALFIGNNSGPKHIAAALGVPTIGIHSGVVDPKEWGPLGDTAVAVKRQMTCAPCYLAKREDCHRGLACVASLSPSDVLPICLRFLKLERGSTFAW